MAVFSTNQNRHLYVVAAVKDAAPSVNGDIQVKTVKSENGAGDKVEEIYFVYKNLKTGEIVKSDRIPVKNLDYVKLTEAADMRSPLKSVKVTLNTDVNGGDVVPGQDYLLRIVFRQFYGMGDQDQYVKDVAVRGTAAMESDSKEFYKAVVAELNKAFAREIGASATENPYLKFSAGTSGSEDGIYITEKEQAYTVGIGDRERVYFDVFPTTIWVDNAEQVWGVKNDVTPTTKNSLVITPGASQTGIGNGPDIAALEWFCMGERGDQYRMAGWPNYIPTQYCVNASEEYDVLDIHFAFTDTGVNSYRSEKDITIVAEAGDDIAAAVKDAIEGAINPSASSDEEP